MSTNEDGTRFRIKSCAVAADGFTFQVERVHEYVYAGQIERVIYKKTRHGRVPVYTWREGWSLNGNTYPWLTKREAQDEARAAGAVARFER